MDNNEDSEDIKQLSIRELIARSSLGTPEAVAIRRRTPAWVLEEILAGLSQAPDR